MSHRHCCEAMNSHVNTPCDQHTDPFACPDALISFTARFQEYGLIVHDGGTSTITIEFCPWCGRRLPESQRDRWFDELERRGINPWEGEIPTEFHDDRWLDFTSSKPGELPHLQSLPKYPRTQPLAGPSRAW